MENAVELKLGEKGANGSEGAFLLGILRSAGQERDEVPGRRNGGGNDIDTEEASGRVKENGQNFGSGDLFCAECAGANELTKGSGRAQVKVLS